MSKGLSENNSGEMPKSKEDKYTGYSKREKARQIIAIIKGVKRTPSNKSPENKKERIRQILKIGRFLTWLAVIFEVAILATQTVIIHTERIQSDTIYTYTKRHDSIQGKFNDSIFAYTQRRDSISDSSERRRDKLTNSQIDQLKILASASKSQAITSAQSFDNLNTPDIKLTEMILNPMQNGEPLSLSVAFSNVGTGHAVNNHICAKAVSFEFPYDPSCWDTSIAFSLDKGKTFKTRVWVDKKVITYQSTIDEINAGEREINLIAYGSYGRIGDNKRYPYYECFAYITGKWYGCESKSKPLMLHGSE